MGATWGDGPAREQIPAPRSPSRKIVMHTTSHAEADAEEWRPDPRLERTLADLRQSLERWHHGDLSGLGIIAATRAYLAALDGEPEEADTS